MIREDDLIDIIICLNGTQVSEIQLSNIHNLGEPGLSFLFYFIFIVFLLCQKKKINK